MSFRQNVSVERARFTLRAFPRDRSIGIIFKQSDYIISIIRNFKRFINKHAYFNRTGFGHGPRLNCTVINAKRLRTRARSNGIIFITAVGYAQNVIY